MIKSKTIATQPTNRARTRIGIGEEVRLTTDPSESVTWSIVGDDGKKGKLSTATGTATTYTAHDRAVGVTIEAKCSCHTETIGLTVVQPNHGTLESPTDISVLTSTTAKVGFVAVQHFQPNDVSFINCEHKEGTCPGTATGVLSSIDGITHKATGDWILCSSTVNAKGTALAGTDTVTNQHQLSRFPSGGTTDGNFHWPIPWRIQVRGGGQSGEFVFDTLDHVASYTSSSRLLRVDKGGSSAQRNIP